MHTHTRTHACTHTRIHTHTHTHTQGVGDSAQGFANAILFVMFTSTVRRTVFKPKYWRTKLMCSKEDESEPLLDPDRASLPNISINSPRTFSDTESLSDIYTPTKFAGSGSYTAGSHRAHTWSNLSLCMYRAAVFYYSFYWHFEIVSIIYNLLLIAYYMNVCNALVLQWSAGCFHGFYTCWQLVV